MLNSVSVTNPAGETLVMDLRNPEKSGFLVYNIDGLGPAKASINSTALSTSDGAAFNSSRVDSRNIVISMLYFEQSTIEYARHRVYKYFPIKRKIKLTFHTDNRDCAIDGYVESNELSIFSSQEGSQISIVCPNPYFYSLENQITEFFGIEGGFTFKFANASITEPKLHFGILKTDVRNYIHYDGDTDVGVRIQVHAMGPVEGLVIYDVLKNHSMRIDSQKIVAISGSGIGPGDDIVISTEKGNKYIRLIRSGRVYNILNAVSRNITWFELFKGDNIFAYSAKSGSQYLQFRIENKILYEGL